ncbi:hypothetical protein [Shinella sedimenti]|uniref:Tellurite resistance protein TerB n=1 Tax=Shinella sedimenti TaxID=2919913 RepID=A0ABT0CRI0_9HYPH|nr:hypothetical protein [Shinella sedimenti]MCJ8151182.1 hypothetical protein [Shinella sedimenti]
MHLVGLLVMVLGGAAVWYWRFKMVREAGSEVVDSIERMRGAYKRKQFRQKAEAAPLASIADPAIAAVAFFLALAAEKPHARDQASAVIRTRMSRIIKPQDMDEVLIFADWATRNVVNPQDPIRRFRDLWLSRLDIAERQELVAIADAVASVEGDPTAEQAETLQALRRTLLN